MAILISWCSIRETRRNRVHGNSPSNYGIGQGVWPRKSPQLELLRTSVRRRFRERRDDRSLPLTFKPRRGARESYVRVREQARLQVEARLAGAPVFELIQPIEPVKGLRRLPQPSPGDLFLDLEGDPFAGENGREYLFGLVTLNDAGQPVYQARWALTSTDEARAFSEVVG
jgi:hypothetical protein